MTALANPPAKALLLDVGYVIIDMTWPAIKAFGRATGLLMPDPDESATADPASDRYWDDIARLAGFTGFRPLFRSLLQTVPDTMIDPAAMDLVGDARAAGKRTGVLSNDAYTYAGREFFAGRSEFTRLDAFVDAAEIGFRKPAAEAYLRAADQLGVAPHDVVFLDDTPECVDGALNVGMLGVHVDPSDKAPAFDEARRLLGLEG